MGEDLSAQIFWNLILAEFLPDLDNFPFVNMCWEDLHIKTSIR